MIFEVADLPEGTSQDNEKRRQDMEARMQQRAQALKDKGEDLVDDKDPEEDLKLIGTRVASGLESIRARLPQWKALGDDRALIERHFEELFTEYKALREYVANYSYSIIAHNLQTYQANLDNLNEQINKEKETALPKKKFAFARKQAPAK